MKKLAVVVSSWHYGYQFYKAIAEQKLPKGWSMELFCVSHRDPIYSQQEKKDKVFEGERAYLDERLYSSIISVNELRDLGWNYKEYPNTIGDWGNSNQWLEDHNYKDYDLILFTHDDNLILGNDWFMSVIKNPAFKEWEILCNSSGMPDGWIRGSCEFFKPSFIEKIGGKFDLSDVSLTREGETTVSEDIGELNDWNNTIHKTMEFIEKNDIPVGYMSSYYRVSWYCIEGERGYISNTHGINTVKENEGLTFLKQNGRI